MHGAQTEGGHPLLPRSSVLPRRRKLRVLGSLLAAVLLVTACGSKTEIVYVDTRDHDEPGHGAYTPFSRSTSQRVHVDGHHEPPEELAIGPAAHGGSEEPYAPLARAHHPQVHPDGKHRVAPSIAIGDEPKPATADSFAAPASPNYHPALATPTVRASAGSAPANKAAAGKPQVAAQVAASPTPSERVTRGSAAGEMAGPPIAPTAVALTDDDDELTTISGRVAGTSGRTLAVETADGKIRVELSDRVRIDFDALGSAADLRPGQFVGIQHLPSGPATSVRLYPIGPSMPRPGVVPLVDSRAGHVTTFGSIVTLQFGGLLLNTGGETTTVTLPGTVEILKPASASSADLVVGHQIIATGPAKSDGTIVATGVRVTGLSRPDR